MTGERTLRENSIDLDKNLTSVMPDTWEGHARLRIRESDNVPQSIEGKAIEKASKLSDKYDIEPEKAAEKLISKLADKSG